MFPPLGCADCSLVGYYRLQYWVGFGVRLSGCFNTLNIARFCCIYYVCGTCFTNVFSLYGYKVWGLYTRTTEIRLILHGSAKKGVHILCKNDKIIFVRGLELCRPNPQKESEFVSFVSQNCSLYTHTESSSSSSSSSLDFLRRIRKNRNPMAASARVPSHIRMLVGSLVLT